MPDPNSAIGDRDGTQPSGRVSQRDQGELFGAPRPPGAPPFLDRPARADAPRSNRGWWWLALALAPLLLIQIGLERLPALAGQAAWRERLETVCRSLPCTLPGWHQPDALRITSREVRPHPTVPGALLITATFRNDAQWAQAWPSLQVVLSDLRGAVVGGRRFVADEYLGASPDRAQILPGQSAAITLELIDPGRDTVAFSLDFL